MSEIRIDLEATLKVLSPLHVGSGDYGPVEGVAGDGEAPPDVGQPDVARIVRDAGGNPLLPSTTVKGMLRGLARTTSTLRRWEDILFGTVKTGGTDQDGEPETGGQRGALTVFAAPCGQPGDASAYPYGGQAGVGAFVAARVSLAPDSGVAQDGLLFFQEMVVPDTTFRLRLRIERPKGEETLEAVKTLLSLLTVPQGVPLGKGQADGFGRVCLLGETVELRRTRITPEGTVDMLAPERIRLPDRPAPDGEGGVGVQQRQTLLLHCPGPFVVLDPSRKAEQGTTADGTPQLQAQRRAETLPLLLGTSLSGALRARADWLEALHRHRNGLPEPGAEEETPVTRLFGRVGQRGLLVIERNDLQPADPDARLKDMTSVRLDRFTGAPIDNALFTTRTFVDVRLTVTLALTARPGFEPGKDGLRLFRALLDDVRCNGLTLGHGVNKGFGWFDCEEGVPS